MPEEWNFLTGEKMVRETQTPRMQEETKEGMKKNFLEKKRREMFLLHGFFLPFLLSPVFSVFTSLIFSFSFIFFSNLFFRNDYTS